MTGNKGAGMDVLRLTLRQLQVFVAVARSGSTTAASAQIALSQSATSAAVNEGSSQKTENKARLACAE